MVEELPRQVPIESVAASVDGKMPELPQNGALPRNVAESQVLEGTPGRELPLHQGKEVIFVDDNDSGQEDAGKAKVDENAPRYGLRFKTYDDALEYYKQYAADSGFSTIILKSSYLKSGVCRRLVLGCSRAGRGRANACYLSRETVKINCPARISLKLRQDRWLHIDDAKLDHNHPLNQSSEPLMSCYTKLTDAKNREAASSRLKGRRNVPIPDKVQGNFTEIGRLKFGEGDDEHIQKFFGTMQNKNPNFFYLLDLDKKGRLRNLFWSDARSQAAYEYFGQREVVYFDTSYLTEKYDLPLVFFTGMNNHGQSVLFGTGLLSDLSADSYTWLFRAFLACMKHQYPNAIITEHYNAILDAAREVFSQVRHRLCLYRIMRDVAENLKTHAEFKTIKRALKKVTYGSLKKPEFEADWKRIIEDHGLAENQCLSSLYEHRELWAPAYLKDQFWVGMSVSQRGESVASYYDGFVYPKTSLKQFFSKYEMILESKYKKELQADEESSHRTPLTVTKFYMEEQLAKAYTINMFRKFQDELKATMYCDGMPSKVDGSIVTFEVKECSYMEDGKETESRTCEVYFDKEGLTVVCECGFYQFTGILCRHALSVLKLHEMFEIPSAYVLDRWKRDYKKLHALVHYPNEMLLGDTVERHDYLFTQCRQLLNLGFISDNRYLVALKLLREAEKALLDEGQAAGERQLRLLSFEAETPENGQGLFGPEFSEGVRNSLSTNAKRRGRPAKEVADNSDAALRSNKEQDFLRSSFVTAEANMIQGTPSASHHESPHMEVHAGIDLMEGISPNLSFGAPFAMDVNHQHHQLPNQPRMMPNNFMQVQADPHAFENQWGYNPTVQDNSIIRTPTRRAG